MMSNALSFVFVQCTIIIIINCVYGKVFLALRWEKLEGNKEYNANFVA